MIHSSLRPLSRRVLLAAALAGAATPAFAQALVFAPGAPWLPADAGQQFPMAMPPQSSDGRTTLAQAMNRRPGVVKVRAT